jgi:hypothetical protein
MKTLHTGEKNLGFRGWSRMNEGLSVSKSKSKSGSQSFPVVALPGRFFMGNINFPPSRTRYLLPVDTDTDSDPDTEGCCQGWGFQGAPRDVAGSDLQVASSHTLQFTS